MAEGRESEGPSEHGRWSITRKVGNNSKMAAGVRRAHFKLLISIRNNYGAFGCLCCVVWCVVFVFEQQPKIYAQWTEKCSPAHRNTSKNHTETNPKSFYLCFDRTEDGQIVHVARTSYAHRTFERTIGCSGDAERLIPYIRTNMIYISSSALSGIFLSFPPYSDAISFVDHDEASYFWSRHSNGIFVTACLGRPVRHRSSQNACVT